MGYGLIRCTGSQLHLLEMGVLRLPTREDNYVRLKLIQQKVKELIGQYGPHDFAIEAPFFGKNVQSMLKLGRAQGVAIAAAMMSGLHATEYAPRKIKQSITGRGNATKEQVLKMLQHTLNIIEDVRFMDATDAVAVALCHHYQHRTAAIKNDNKLSGKTKKVNDWVSFIAQNPDRIK